jgi:hypothetical protein
VKREKKPPHRPPLDPQHPSTSVHLRLPAPQYDDTYHRAQSAGVSVPEQLRRDLQAATFRYQK